MLAVAAAISSHINASTGEAWPSRARLAAIVGTTEREVSRAIKRLRELGLLEVASGAGRGKTSRYRVCDQSEKLGDDNPKNSGDDNPGCNNPGLPEPVNSGDDNPKNSGDDNHPERYRERNRTLQAAPSRLGPAQTKLGIDADLYNKRRALLNAIWSLLEPTGIMSGAKSKTQWTRENGAVAMDLAREGATPEQCAVAWHSASARVGSPARTMKLIQDEIVRRATGKTASAPMRTSPSDHGHGAQTSLRRSDPITPDLSDAERAASDEVRKRILADFRIKPVAPTQAFESPMNAKPIHQVEREAGRDDMSEHVA